MDKLLRVIAGLLKAGTRVLLKKVFFMGKENLLLNTRNRE